MELYYTLAVEMPYQHKNPQRERLLNLQSSLVTSLFVSRAGAVAEQKLSLLAIPNQTPTHR